MPIYEYRCSHCGHKLEALQKISEPLLVSCPSCHEDKLVKQVSAAGFQLKGSGWYVTDFRGNGTSKPAKADDTDKPAADAKTGDDKSDSKSVASPTETAATTSASTTTTPAPAAKPSTPTPTGSA